MSNRIRLVGVMTAV